MPPELTARVGEPSPMPKRPTVDEMMSLADAFARSSGYFAVFKTNSNDVIRDRRALESANSRGRR